MKTLGALLFVFILPFMFPTALAATCPIASEMETALDCPWAGIARDLDGETSSIRVQARLSELAPEYVKQLDSEANLTEDMKLLWGHSINFDEGAKAIIVPNAILDAILLRAKVPARGEGVESTQPERIAHAGFEHTYGYLLSNLKTPYGYKRLRWVRPDIENGFGLPPGTIAPLPTKGGLFANITYFAGQIAFRGDNEQEVAARKVLRAAKGMSRAVRIFNYKSLHGRRLTEVLKLSDGRTVEIRTDFVPFTVTSGDTTGGNTELLIYSFRDSALKLPYLVTAFPIAKGFSDSAMNPKNLGNDKPITTRYNAWVPDVTESKRLLKGKRSASTF